MDHYSVLPSSKGRDEDLLNFQVELRKSFRAMGVLSEGVLEENI